MMKQRVWPFAAFAVWCFVAGTALAADLSVVGTWHTKPRPGLPSTQVVFRGDGTAFFMDEPAAYTLRGSELILTADGESWVYALSLQGNEMRISGGDLDEPLVLVRSETTASGSPDTGKPRAATAGGTVQAKPGSGGHNVVINGMRLTEARVEELERGYGVRIQDGRYWYDRMCGAWGMEGGPALGVIAANLDLGGPLRPDASGGGTGVFINGRQLHMQDVAGLQQITPVQPGRYWLDAQGNFGYEGVPVAVGNLLALVRSRGGGSRPWMYRSEMTGIGAGGDGETTYVMGKDFSVIVGP